MSSFFSKALTYSIAPVSVLLSRKLSMTCRSLDVHTARHIHVDGGVVHGGSCNTRIVVCHADGTAA